jgi:RNA polymerase sigma-70 factor, ECF subfamily
MRSLVDPSAVQPRPVDVHAFAERHFDFVWRIVRRFGLSAAESDDVAQEVFLVVARKVGQIDEGKERSYLFSVALQLARKARQRLGRLEPWSETFEVAVEPGHDERIDDVRARNLLDLALHALGEDLREVLVLHDLEELTMAEIAETLGLPPGTVASRLRRARVEFKQTVTRLKGSHER